MVVALWVRDEVEMLGMSSCECAYVREPFRVSSRCLRVSGFFKDECLLLLIG